MVVWDYDGPINDDTCGNDEVAKSSKLSTMHGREFEQPDGPVENMLGWHCTCSNWGFLQPVLQILESTPKVINIIGACKLHCSPLTCANSALFTCASLLGTCKSSALFTCASLLGTCKSSALFHRCSCTTQACTRLHFCKHQQFLLMQSTNELVSGSQRNAMKVCPLQTIPGQSYFEMYAALDDLFEPDREYLTKQDGDNLAGPAHPEELSDSKVALLDRVPLVGSVALFGEIHKQNICLVDDNQIYGSPAEAAGYKFIFCERDTDASKDCRYLFETLQWALNEPDDVIAARILDSGAEHSQQLHELFRAYCFSESKQLCSYAAGRYWITSHIVAMRKENSCMMPNTPELCSARIQSYSIPSLGTFCLGCTCSCEGWLRKKGTGMFDGWQTRWFTINAEDQILKWYKDECLDEPPDEPKGLLFMSVVQSASYNRDAQSIKLHTDGRIYELETKNVADFDKWKAAFEPILRGQPIPTKVDFLNKKF